MKRTLVLIILLLISGIHVKSQTAEQLEKASQWGNDL
jgi:hypothetical protein